MAELPKVTVTGTIYEPDGVTLYNGDISFWLPVLLRHADGTVVLPSDVSRTVTVVNGEVSVELVYVDHPDWTPQDFTWEVRIPRGSIIRKYGLKPSVDDPDSVNLGDLLSTEYVPAAGAEYAAANHSHPGDVSQAEMDEALENYAAVVHTHTASQVTDFTAAVNAVIDAQERIFTEGELVVRRNEAGQFLPLESGVLYIAHYTALTTRTILSARTMTGDTGASGTDNAWIGFLNWTGTEYTLGGVSVDDPTRWANPNTPYPAQIFQADGFGAANLSQPGFQQVAGNEYGMFVLWNGDGDSPLLNAASFAPADAFLSPRKAVYMPLTAPPSGPLQAGWVAGVRPRFQALLTS